MNESQKVFTLSDRAIALYFALKEFGPMTSEELRKLLRKSPATFYRSVQELRSIDILPGKRVTALPAKKKRPSKPYTLSTNLSHAQ